MNELKIRKIHLPLNYNRLDEKRLNVVKSHCEVYQTNAKHETTFIPKTNVKTDLSFWQDECGSLLVMVLGDVLLTLGVFFLFLNWFDPRGIFRMDMCLAMIFSGLILLAHFFSCESRSQKLK